MQEWPFRSQVTTVVPRIGRLRKRTPLRTCTDGLPDPGGGWGAIRGGRLAGGGWRGGGRLAGGAALLGGPPLLPEQRLQLWRLGHPRLDLARTLGRERPVSEAGDVPLYVPVLAHLLLVKDAGRPPFHPAAGGTAGDGC